MLRNFTRAIPVLLIFWYVPVYGFKNTAVITAQIINHDPSYQPHWDSLCALADDLKKYGLVLVQEPADVILCSEVTEDVLAHQRPIIICDPIDTCVVPEPVLESLKNPLVKAVFKNFGVKPIGINITPRVYWGYHFKILNDYHYCTCPQRPTRLSRKLLKKIKVVQWSPSHSMIRDDFNEKKRDLLDLKKERPIDVFFAGKIMYNYPGSEVAQVMWHRKQAVDRIKNMKDIKTFISEGDFPLPYDEYIEKMRESKIAVSPWGYGEWCWRDFEGMLCGAVVIKPHTPYIKSIPRIYFAGRTYIPCKPDFSDLQKKIERILRNWPHYTRFRKRAHNLIVKTTIDDFAKNLAYNVRRLLR